MIHYQLRCENDHAFDGWFRSSDAFDSQARTGHITCPACASAKVRRALMAPALGKNTPVPAEASAAPASTPAPVAGGVLPDALRAMLQRLRTEVEARCDYVGPGFAEEARRIHQGESTRRGIYGEATSEEAERLAEDGIEVARIPWLPRADG